MEPEWSDLKILLALSRAGSVAGAARSLGVDQSTVSRRLAALEESVGARLVLRGGREFAFTAEGRTMASAAERAEAAVVEASRSVREGKLEISGKVRVSSLPGLMPPLVRAIAAARETYPALTIELSLDRRAVDLAKGEADMGLRMFRPTEGHLVARKLTDVGWAVYASREYA